MQQSLLFVCLMGHAFLHWHFNYLFLSHNKIFWVFFLLLSQTEHLNSLEQRYCMYSCVLLFISFCSVLLLSPLPFSSNTLNYLPAKSQFGALYSPFYRYIFLADFPMYLLLFFLFLPVSLLNTLFFLANLKPFCPVPLAFPLSKLMAMLLKKNLSTLWSLCFLFLSPLPFRHWAITTILGVLVFIQPRLWQWIIYDIKQVRLNLITL